MLEVQGNRLDWKWVGADGVIRDRFTMMKGVNQQHVLSVKKGESITLTAPFTGDYHWSTGKANTKVPGGDQKSITITPSSTTIYTVKDSFNCLKDVFEVKVVR
jgi:hypothetical protein